MLAKPQSLLFLIAWASGWEGTQSGQQTKGEQ